MGFAKLPSQAPAFDAAGLAKALKLTDAQTRQLVAWKRWAEATSEFDGTGLRDVVAANAQGLNAVKANVDSHTASISELTARVRTLEARPSIPFPGSG